MNVFNEKTVEVLKSKNNTGTETFVRLVTRFIDILNVKSRYAGNNLNDPDRLPFVSCNDERFKFLENGSR